MHCGVQSFTSCAEAFHDGEEIQGASPLRMMEKNLAGFSLQKKERDHGSKKKTITKNQTAINSQFMHTKHTRI